MTERAKERTRKRERTCASCREATDPGQLVRFVRSEEGEVFPDLTRRSFGRGAWLHARPECLKRPAQSLARSFRAAVSSSRETILQRMRAAGSARVWQLLGSARRRGALAVGGGEAEQAWVRDRAKIVLVAQDARAVATTAWVSDSIASGKARVWGTKDALGRLCARSEVGVVAIVDESLADGIFDAIAMALLAADHEKLHPPGERPEGATPASEGNERDVLTEVE